ncbi:MAG: hypothetical protein IMF26_05205 [Candidatus Fermentithermobacillus carboniphilus]|uniref:Uncharacterized protein n=1 Tax=Candidatus Fermentithermobacillus carboniphilus TaxID=3085328 RepID=A0AAT9LEH3_9FIRM|nr:MAG: hypothetical protein IMF26_05205 [Candidatus Fermentithermobacillus carboniphilus]
MHTGTTLPYLVKQPSKIKDISKEAKVRLAFLDFTKNHPVVVGTQV